MVVAKATLAKARRDATFQVVPGALCKAMEDAARSTAIGTTATLGKRRSLLIDWVNKCGIEPERVWAALGISGIDDVGLKELETLTGIKTAIKDGDVTADEAFPREPVKMPTVRKAEQAEPERSTERVADFLEVEGVYDQVEVIKGKTGKRQWEKHSVEIDGVKYGTFDTEIWAELEQFAGKPVSILYETDGKYNTIKSVGQMSGQAKPDAGDGKPVSNSLDSGKE